jgi:hypothetical protein
MISADRSVELESWLYTDSEDRSVMSIILKILAAVLLGLLALIIGYYVLGWISLFVYTLVIVAVVAAICFGIFMLVKPKKKMQMLKQYKVWDMQGRQIYVFRNEPAIDDIVKLNDELHMTKLELQGDVFRVQNDSAVIVLEDNDKQAVKIRLKDAKKKAVDAEGWIARSALAHETKRITGPGS